MDHFKGGGSGAAKTGDLWRVETEDGRVFLAHRLAVCTGVHQRQRPASGPVTGFSGRLIHSGDVKHPLDLGVGAGDHVVV